MSSGVVVGVGMESLVFSMENILDFNSSSLSKSITQINPNKGPFPFKYWKVKVLNCASVVNSASV